MHTCTVRTLMSGHEWRGKKESHKENCQDEKERWKERRWEDQKGSIWNQILTSFSMKKENLKITIKGLSREMRG